MLSFSDILAPQGIISKRLEKYESRNEQLEMSQAITEAIDCRSHLAVEAGTGVGKSFAYLVPALLYACKDQEKKEREKPDEERWEDEDEANKSLLSPRSAPKTPIPRAVISTHTISLQEQLIHKDLPFLNSILPLEFSSVLVKGRSNYLCQRRLYATLRKTTGMFSGFQQNELMRIGRWAKETSDGSLSDLSPRPNWEVWDDVCCESGNCLGTSCMYRQNCFYAKARQRISGAQILIVNHSLLFSDLALRMASTENSAGSILPSFDVLVFDEAHTMEQVAADHLGLSISQGAVDYNLNKLFNEKSQKGLLIENGFRSEIQQVRECQVRAENFFSELFLWLNDRPGGNGRVREPNIVKNSLCEGLNRLTAILRDCNEKIKDSDQRQEMRSARNRIATLADEINVWMNQSEDGFVYWLEAKQTRNLPKISAHSAPIDVGPMLREHLFGKVATVIMTSATLSTGASADKATPRELEHAFDFFKSRIGLTQVDTLQLGSPFDYEEQATLVLVKGLLSPDVKTNQWNAQLCDMLRKYLTETDGHAFVLFTSYTQLKAVASMLTPWLSERNMLLLSQADGTPRSQLLEQFKATPRSVLFGTDSFWQGVDVPGDSLQNVIITKLPFLVPDQPLTEARLEMIQESGGNPFGDYQLPHAILKFKQGFGRLIRTKTDHGIVVILDQRIHSKSYGRQFLAALPKCGIRIDQK